MAAPASMNYTDLPFTSCSARELCFSNTRPATRGPEAGLGHTKWPEADCLLYFPCPGLSLPPKGPQPCCPAPAPSPSVTPVTLPGLCGDLQLCLHEPLSLGAPGAQPLPRWPWGCPHGHGQVSWLLGPLSRLILPPPNWSSKLLLLGMLLQRSPGPMGSRVQKCCISKCYQLRSSAATCSW